MREGDCKIMIFEEKAKCLLTQVGLRRNHSRPERYMRMARICFLVGNISDLLGYDRAQQNGVKRHFAEGRRASPSLGLALNKLALCRIWGWITLTFRPRWLSA